MANKAFSFCIPVELNKGADDEWRIRGLASTESKDLQGEIVKQSGLDISALKAGLGLFNYDHEKGPENILGAIEDADLTDKGLMVEGYLFKHQPRAKAFYDIMRSLKPNQSKRVQMSIEGKIIKRDGEQGKTVAQAKVEKVALTVDPINTDTYAEIAKSLQEFEKETEAEKIETINQEKEVDLEDRREVIKSKIGALFNVRLLNKALAAGIGYAGAPGDMTGGSVLMSESVDRKIKDVKSFDDETKEIVKKMAKALSRQFPHMSKYKVLKSIVSRMRSI